LGYDKNGKLSLNDYKFKLFLENRGFYKVQLNDKEFTFVKVYNNIINEVNEVQIKDFVLNHVIEVDMQVYNFFAKSTNKFTEGYLNQLDTKDLTMIRDTAETSYLFFKNKVVEVKIDSVNFIDYINIGGFVWQKNIIDYNFKITQDKSDFETFILNISNQDESRKLTLETSIGYLLNTYKKQDEGLAIVYYDETLNDNPSGRTGKTLISKALGHMRKLVTLNGKEFNNKGQFPYQTINLDDNIICFDDMERSFKFETLFSIITGNQASNVLVKGTSTQVGRYSVCDFFTNLAVYNPSDTATAAMQYTMFVVPDLDDDNNYYGLVSPLTTPSDSGGIPSMSSSCCARIYAGSGRLDYLITPVTTGAWQQVIGSVSASVTHIDVFDSSGETMELGVGGSGSETRVGIIPPGGISIDLVIPLGERISVRAISGTANVGEIDISAYS